MLAPRRNCWLQQKVKGDLGNPRPRMRQSKSEHTLHKEWQQVIVGSRWLEVDAKKDSSRV